MKHDFESVTIGIPFYNPGKQFEAALKSVFAQTYKNWELILVNDGSTDGSLELATKINDSRVKVISDGENRGLASRLNEITRKASGKFIARMDADDIMHPSRIEKQIRYLNSNHNLDAATTGCYLLNSLGDPVSIRNLEKPSVNEVFLRGGYLHASMLGRREWFKNHLYDESLTRAEDRDLFIRAVLDDSQIDVVPEPLYFYRFIGNVRVKAWLDSYEQERKLLRKYGDQGLGLVNTRLFLLRSHLKTIVLNMLYVIKKENSIQMKCENISVDKMRDIAAIIEYINSQELPLDDRGAM